MGCLQFITHHNEHYTHLDTLRMALEGGCRWVQLRMKGADDEQLLAAAREAKELCVRYGSQLIIDDNPYVAREVLADGVHLGREDMPVREARQLLGERFIIGATANTIDDVRAHSRDGADYIGCGPFRYTTTKERLSPILGLEGYRSIVSQMRAEGIALPIVAIGGITAADISAVMATGVSGIALSGEVLRAENPVEKMRQIIKQIEEWNSL